MLKNLKKLRTDAKVSQKQLADVIGVSQQSINKYENHKIEPDIHTLILIADYFNTSVDYLIGHTEGKSTEIVLSSSEINMLSNYRRLNDKQKKSVQLVIENYVEN